jgi:hypothetical protein
MKDVSYVQKTVEIRFGGSVYMAAGEAAIIAAIRPAMVTHGLVIVPESTSILHQEVYRQANGKSTNRVILHVQWKVLHTSGESITVSSIGEGIDTGDKGVPKALTGAYKYALRQVFCLETGEHEDPDCTSSEEQERDPYDPPPAQMDTYRRMLEGIIEYKGDTAVLEKTVKKLTKMVDSGDLLPEYSKRLVTKINEYIKANKEAGSS